MFLAGLLFAANGTAAATLHIAGTGGIIPSIFTAEYPKWPDGLPLKIILRTKVGADTVIVGQATAPAPRFARTTRPG